MSTYRALLARPGARALALACGLGWLSFGSYGLAVVLAVHAASGSFAAAGAAVAAFSAGSGLLAPVRGRFVDARGPRALALFAPVHAAGLALLVLGCAEGWSQVALVVVAGGAGATCPPLIATGRSVWPGVAGPELSQAAHALNAALGDAAMVVGPAAVGALAALVSPAFALAAVIPGPAAGALLVARRAAVPEADGGHAEDVAAHAGAVMPAAAASLSHRVFGALRESAGLRTLAFCDLVLGLGWGALDVALPAAAAREGSPELAALPFALMAAGSVTTSVLSGSVRRPAATRYVAGSLLLAVAVLPCLGVRSVAGVTAILLVAGACFGVLNVALFELLDDVVAPERGVEALTWLTSLQGAGAAAGAAVAGGLGAGGLGLLGAAGGAAPRVGGGRRGALLPPRLRG